MIRYKLSIVAIAIFMFAGCKRSNPELMDFTYKFTMESIGNYKVEFQMNSDSTYKIEQNNYFFDKYEGVSRPVVRQGNLTTEEYIELRELVSKSGINDMRESYGFEKNNNLQNSILYIIELVQNGQSKFISINANGGERFPDDFNRLIETTGDFIDYKLDE
ncbi:MULTISPECIES: hypothetical protein [Proteiniphilum]|jgi:hypothetical protein|uniref:hypothetical protein n=1 Tax=Proteiniphilum TaxID=294702 RepID=UPI001EEC8099|nr:MULTISPECIES: hypothetical protein [Proteiniphilum]MDD4415697.1 hypothetical protein [Proteiniphilum sp.]ULB35124.1 hypothetical protein KDN43_03520 [Proteiniphilum propionicum]